MRYEDWQKVNIKMNEIASQIEMYCAYVNQNSGDELALDNISYGLTHLNRDSRALQAVIGDIETI